MNGNKLAAFQRQLEHVLHQLQTINAKRRSPLCIGVGLLRFQPHAKTESGLESELQKLEAAAVLERIHDSLRQRDVVTRVDDSTIGVILRGLESPEHLELAGGKLKRELKAPVVLLDDQLPIRYHAGLIYNKPGETAPQLLQRTVNAVMSAAKQGQAVCYGERTTQVEEANAQLEAELSAALATGEFVPYFQPKVSAAYNNLVGVEVLTRWHSKARGVIGPGEFIGALETANLIEPFTHRTLRTALNHAMQWREALPVSVNVPGSLLNSGALEIAIRDALELFAIAPERLVIEITENSVAKDLSESAKRLQAIRSLGVGISIDDFGTGYSSLAYLREFPATEVKLDRQFLEGIEQHNQARALIDGIIRLAHALDLKVVAEGIESKATAELLRSMNCDYLQGYLFGKPLPPEQFAEWLGRQLGAA